MPALTAERREAYRAAIAKGLDDSHSNNIDFTQVDARTLVCELFCSQENPNDPRSLCTGMKMIWYWVPRNRAIGSVAMITQSYRNKLLFLQNAMGFRVHSQSAGEDGTAVETVPAQPSCSVFRAESSAESRVTLSAACIDILLSDRKHNTSVTHSCAVFHFRNKMP